MTGTPASPELELPADPSFTPEVYARTSLLLRGGVIGFFVFSTIGVILGLIANPSESVSTLLQANPFAGWGSFGEFLSSLAHLQSTVLILVGVFIMVGVSVARVLDAMVSFFRGRELIMAAVCATVAGLLILGLTVVASIIH